MTAAGALPCRAQRRVPAGSLASKGGCPCRPVQAQGAGRPAVHGLRTCCHEDLVQVGVPGAAQAAAGNCQAPDQAAVGRIEERQRAALPITAGRHACAGALREADAAPARPYGGAPMARWHTRARTTAEVQGQPGAGCGARARLLASQQLSKPSSAHLMHPHL